MRLRQIVHMNVVANASAVRGGIVLAKDFDVVAPAESHVKNERNDVGLGLMRFAPAGNGPSNVEITQAGIAQAMNAVDPGEHLLHQQLRFSISIGGNEGGVFSDGGAHGFTV